MAETVSDVLAQRARAGEPPPLVAGLLSTAAHAAFFGMLLVMAKPKPMKVVPLSLPVRVVSPSALLRPGPPAAAAPAPAAPAAPAEPVAPPAGKKPVIEKPADKPRASEKALPLPSAKKEKEKPVPKAAGPASPDKGTRPAAAGPAVDLPAANGSAGEGGALGGFGAAVSFFDADFPFAYYVEQLQALIGANWLKPSAPDKTAVVVSFRILRSGQVTDVKIDAPSGVAVYDRAAARAIYAANPLPPLPPEYRGDALGVHIRFQ